MRTYHTEKLYFCTNLEQRIMGRNPIVKSGTAISFAEFWNAYGLKRDKIAAERAWNRLSEKDKRAALDGIKTYRDDCATHNRMMMYAQGYINHRRWEDEIEADSRPDNGKCPVDESKIANPLVATRDASDAELAALEAFKEGLRHKDPCKPYRWDDFITMVVNRIRIAFVSKDTVIHLYLASPENPKQGDLITDYMIDYYDSYEDFYNLLARHFDIRKVTFLL